MTAAVRDSSPVAPVAAQTEAAAVRARARLCARLAAVQQIYALAFAGVDPLQPAYQPCCDAADVDPQATDRQSVTLVSLPCDQALRQQIVVTCHRCWPDLDAMIRQALPPTRPFAAVPLLALSILRAACAEIASTPTPAARDLVNDYVCLAAAFFNRPQVSFVHAVVDRCLRNAPTLSVSLAPERLP